MESFAKNTQKLAQSPGVKRMRALEQKRTTRSTARSDRISHTLKQIDRAVKLEIAEYAKSQAADLEEIAALFDASATEDEDKK